MRAGNQPIGPPCQGMLEFRRSVISLEWLFTPMLQTSQKMNSMALWWCWWSNLLTAQTVSLNYSDYGFRMIQCCLIKSSIFVLIRWPHQHLLACNDNTSKPTYTLPFLIAGFKHPSYVWIDTDIIFNRYHNFSLNLFMIVCVLIQTCFSLEHGKNSKQSRLELLLLLLLLLLILN